MRILASLIVLGSSLTASSYAATAVPVTTAATPFHLTSAGGIVVSVMVDGIGAIPFLVDTGSNGTVVSDRLAERLGASAVAKATVSSAIGHALRPVIRISVLQIGALMSRSVLATVVPSTEFDARDRARDGRPVEGVVGQDVLSALRYTIDYRTKSIEWQRSGDHALPDGAVLALEARDDRFVAVLPQGRTTLRLVPDTGAEALVLFEPAFGPNVTVLDDEIEVGGVSGKVRARAARVAALKVGSTLLTDVPAIVISRDASGASADGLLPLHLFSRVTFDGPERRLIIER